LWHVPSGKALGTLRDDHWASPINALAYSPDGRVLAVAVGQEVTLWEMATRRGRTTLVWPFHDLLKSNLVSHALFSPDGQVLALAGGNERMTFWGPRTGKYTALLEGHTAEVVAAAFSPGGTAFASASLDGTMKLWQVPSGKVTATVNSKASSLAFSPDGKLLATGSMDGTVRLWDVPALLSREARSP
jgi:WD40 repeat protein